MRFTTISTLQLIALSFLMSVLTALLVCVNSWYMIYSQLPEVYVNSTGSCVKVQNFENGHAFNCEDVDVLLRRYRKHTQ